VKKLTQLSILAGAALLLAGGAGAAWLLRDHLTDAPKPDPRRAEYDAFVAHLGGDELAVRDELNALASSASGKMDPADQARANALTRECLDPKTLFEIEHVRQFASLAPRGEASPYHFVSGEQKARLAAIAGENPSAERVVALRKALAKLADEFERIRQPPDWNVNVEGEAPPMPFLELLREGHQFLPAGTHPELRPDPRIPAFAPADAELLAQLDRFFNGARARAAFPPGKFPRLYVNGRIPSIPTALDEYRKQVAVAIGAEMTILTPEENPDPGKVEAIDDTYGKLGRFLEAVAEFGK
jgi:hypothetical protein